MGKVLHFGAGNIGRGFFGQLYFESGWEIVFADVVTAVIEKLNTDRAYPLWIVGDRDERLTIGNCSGIHLADAARVVETGVSADLISTAVGANNLKKLVPLLRDIIVEKFARNPGATLDIVIGENLLDSSTLLASWLNEALPEAFRPVLREKVGLVETVLSRMVPVVPDAIRTEHPLLAMVEPYKTLPVAKTAFRGPLPDIAGFAFVNDLKPYEDMKIFIHNLSHAGFAYLGKPLGRTYIWESVADAFSRETVDRAFEEVRSAIHAEHRVPLDELNSYYRDIISRFQNRRLGDTVARVGRDPVRKLGKNDRIVGAALLCERTGTRFEAICVIGAAALRYLEPSDAESVRLAGMLKTRGIDTVLREVCGLDPTSPVAKLLRERYSINSPTL